MKIKLSQLGGKKLRKNKSLNNQDCSGAICMQLSICFGMSERWGHESPVFRINLVSPRLSLSSTKSLVSLELKEKLVVVAMVVQHCSKTQVNNNIWYSTNEAMICSNTKAKMASPNFLRADILCWIEGLLWETVMILKHCLFPYLMFKNSHYNS